jgi:hypothetical protein
MSNYTNGSPLADNAIAGILQLGDRNLASFTQSDLVQPSQFFKALPWFPASHGTQHKWTVETVAAGAAFRAVNNGVVNSAGSEKLVTANLSYLDCSWKRDVQLGKGFAKGRDVYLEKQTMKALNAGLAKAEASLIRGTVYDANGPDGLDELVQASMKIDAGGAGGTRVYMMIAGEEDVCGILGNDGVFSASEVSEVPVITDASTGASYQADSQGLGGFMCIQVAGKYSLAMAYNIDGTSGDAVDDNLLADLYAKFPSDRLDAVRARGIILMSSTGLKQLRNSRTATNPTGAPAPYPTDWMGVPIVISDAIKDDYAEVTTTTTTGE